MTFAFALSRLGACLRRLVRERRGTTAIEFALVAPMTIALALATLQAGTIFLARAYFETGAQAAAREVLTNKTAAMTADQFKSAVCSQLAPLFDCSQVIVELEPIPAGTTNLAGLLPTFSAAGVLIGNPPVSVGASSPQPGSDALLVVMYPWPVFGGPLGLNFATLGNGTMLMTSTQVFRVELTSS
jgi:Flp pilus assembly protein TadG